jgi:hypothetical protein
MQARIGGWQPNTTRQPLEHLHQLHKQKAPETIRGLSEKSELPAFS